MRYFRYVNTFIFPSVIVGVIIRIINIIQYTHYTVHTLVSYNAVLLEYRGYTVWKKCKIWIRTIGETDCRLNLMAVRLGTRPNGAGGTFCVVMANYKQFGGEP